MKWVSLLRDIKEKVGFSQSPASSPTATAAAGEDDRSPRDGLSPPIASENREKYELELDFKRNWDLFRSSSLEKEKEDALNVAVDIFCRLVKWKTDVSQESINPGLNLLYAIQALVSGHLDKQPLLDSGILCCLIHILNALLSPDNENNQAQAAVSEASILQEKPQNNSVTEAHQLEACWVKAQEHRGQAQQV
ncbi:SPIRRIG protein [Nymphaea thermarum]|nr:SPIRRIG protein [Nymphaea thermarum]